MRSLSVSVLVLSSVWGGGSVLSAAQAAGMSAGSSDSQVQQPVNPWGGASAYGGYPNVPTYAPNYGYGSYPEERDHKKSSVPWNMMNPSRMMNMMPSPMSMPNPMNMFGGNQRNYNNDYPPLPPQGAYPYAQQPYSAYPNAYPGAQMGYPGGYPYQNMMPLGQQAGAYPSAAPSAPTSPNYAPPPPPEPESYPAASQQQNRSGGGMGMGGQRQHAPHNYFQQAQPQNAGYAQNPNYGGQTQPPAGYFPPPIPADLQNQGALIDRSDYSAPPAAMPSAANNPNGGQPLVDRDNYPAPPPVPEMPPMNQGQFDSAVPYPTYPSHPRPAQQPAANEPQYGGYSGQVSPQAGSPYSVPPVVPGLDMYPGQDPNLQPPPPPAN